MKKLCVLLAAVMVLGVCAGAFAGKHHHEHKEQYVREEAARRDMKLLTIDESREIAAKQIGSQNIRFKEIELEDEHDDYPNVQRFRPVYEIECYAGHDEYKLKIDAVTGQVLKFKLDD